MGTTIDRCISVGTEFYGASLRYAPIKWIVFIGSALKFRMIIMLGTHPKGGYSASK